MHKKPKPKPKPKPTPYDQSLRDLLKAFEKDTKQHAHLVLHKLEHMTELLENLDAPQGTPEKVRAIKEQVEQSKAKLTGLLGEAEPPASTESGEPPQG